MAGARTLIVADSAAAPGLRERFGDDPRVAVFTASESLQAVTAMLQRPPDVVILDRAFVTSPRGAALVARVRRDVRLTQVELRLLVQAEELLTIPLKEPYVSTDPHVSANQPLDRFGTRLAVRVPMRGRMKALLDGERCELVNLSITGAQILSRQSVSPHRSIQLTLLDGSAEMLMRGLIVWSAAETSGGGIQYRAGIVFRSPDVHILEGFCRRYGVEPIQPMHAMEPASSLQA